MEPSSVHPHAPSWRHPLVLAGVVSGVMLALIVLCQQVASMQYGATGARYGSRAYTIAQVANSLAFTGEIFLGTFVAGQVGAFLRAQARRERRAALLAALALELALIPAGDPAPADGYRDPVRLTLPGRLLEGDLLDAAGDRELLAALLGLQAAVARYNDLVLTNAVALLGDDDARLAGAIARYRQELDRALAGVRPLLPVG